MVRAKYRLHAPELLEEVLMGDDVALGWILLFFSEPVDEMKNYEKSRMEVFMTRLNPASEAELER